MLRGRRRRYPGHSADRYDDALPFLRRLLPTGQLVPGGNTAADQRPGQTATARFRGAGDGVRGPHPGGEDSVNKPIRRLSFVVALLFCALLFSCLLYTSDAADDLLCVDLGGRRIIK